ncbi:MAG: bifunctional hydroxymethylpyrimidine kinase/phosphomethylpyrimidine kinase, partial [Gemmatimonadota bacterium]|nr:bifunctional hydroxymethylpyrimidine kinase/phosphomethylpyrimidine kinase [Gemmatimonadota bacterium]
GIQADLKTFHQFGVFGTSVIVAITAQNTVAVSSVQTVDRALVLAQMQAVAHDLTPKAVKTGMLATVELVETVASGIEEFGFEKLVVDPVMVATSGDKLLADEAVHAVKSRLIPLATVVTPNIPEAEILVGRKIDGFEEMEEAGRALIAMGANAALIKGGHKTSNEVLDVLVTQKETVRFSNPRIDTTSTHGTGCTLSAAITAGLARGNDLSSSVSDAIDFVHLAIRTAPGLGFGNGPLNHFAPTGHDG